MTEKMVAFIPIMGEQHIPIVKTYSEMPSGFLTPDVFASGGRVTVETPNPRREALEEVFYDWWSANYSCLDFGGAGDVLGLRLALNAAFAKSAEVGTP